MELTHEQMTARIKELAQQCKTRNWDGYDAFGIEKSTVKLSLALIDSGLVDNFKGGIFPDPCGTINFYLDLDESLCIKVHTQLYSVEALDDNEGVDCYSLDKVRERLNNKGELK